MITIYTHVLLTTVIVFMSTFKKKKNKKIKIKEKSLNYR